MYSPSEGRPTGRKNTQNYRTQRININHDMIGLTLRFYHEFNWSPLKRIEAGSQKTEVI